MKHLALVYFSIHSCRIRKWASGSREYKKREEEEEEEEEAMIIVVVIERSIKFIVVLVYTLICYKLGESRGRRGRGIDEKRVLVDSSELEIGRKARCEEEKREEEDVGEEVGRVVTAEDEGFVTNEYDGGGDDVDVDMKDASFENDEGSVERSNSTEGKKQSSSPVQSAKTMSGVEYSQNDDVEDGDELCSPRNKSNDELIERERRENLQSLKAKIEEENGIEIAKQQKEAAKERMEAKEKRRLKEKEEQEREDLKAAEEKAEKDMEPLIAFAEKEHFHAVLQKLYKKELKNEITELENAFKKALPLFHPDRAEIRKDTLEQKILKGEQFKLLRASYARWQSEGKKRAPEWTIPAEAECPDTPRNGQKFWKRESQAETAAAAAKTRTFNAKPPPFQNNNNNNKKPSNPSTFRNPFNNNNFARTMASSKQHTPFNQPSSQASSSVPPRSPRSPSSQL